MGTPGVPFDKTKSDIVDAIKKHKGKLYKAAKELGCHYETIRKYTDPHPEIVELIRNLRQDREESLLDDVEDTLEDALAGRTVDMCNALKAAFFILNSKGKSRGFAPTHGYGQDSTSLKITPEQAQNIINESSK